MTETSTTSPGLRAIERLRYRAWNWSIGDFAKALNEDLGNPQTKARFIAFQTAATALNALDDRTLAVLTGE